MGVDLVGKLDGFSVSRENFGREDHSVEYGCIDAGNHRVLRFNMITLNKGSTDLVIGDPRDSNIQKKFFDPEKKELTEGLGYKFKKQPFFVYLLRNDDSSVKVSGYKEAFCFDGLDPMSCYNQGLAAGGKREDRYESDMACQFVVIDDLSDGEYVLEATVNAQRLIEEDDYGNNTVAVRLQIKGDDLPKIIGKT
jgi:Lysyl oxidase